MSTIKTKIKPSDQIDFVNEEMNQEFKQNLLKQKALGVVNPVSKAAMLKMLKTKVSELKVCQHINHHYQLYGFMESVKVCIGWQDMTEQDQQKINDYLNS